MHGKPTSITLKESPLLPFWWAAFLLPLPLIGTSLIFGFLHFRSPLPPDRDTSLMVYAFSCLMTFGLLVFLVQRKAEHPLQVLGFVGPFRWRDLGYAFLAFVAAGILYEGCHHLLAMVGIPMYHNDDREIPVDPAGIGSTILLLISVCIFVPLSEEGIYRGYLLKSLTQKYQLKAACVISTLLFAVIHYPFFGPGMAIYIIPWTAIAIGLYLYTGSIISSVLFHFLNNIFAYIVAPLLYEG